jgi:hypothetical protein
LQLFRISSKDSAISSYKKVERNLLDELESLPNYSMTLVKYGFSESDSVPAIYVVSPEKVNFTTPIPKELILVNVIGVTRKAMR